MCFGNPREVYSSAHFSVQIKGSLSLVYVVLNCLFIYFDTATSLNRITSLQTIAVLRIQTLMKSRLEPHRRTGGASPAASWKRRKLLLAMKRRHSRATHVPFPPRPHVERDKKVKCGELMYVKCNCLCFHDNNYPLNIEILLNYMDLKPDLSIPDHSNKEKTNIRRRETVLRDMLRHVQVRLERNSSNKTGTDEWKFDRHLSWTKEKWTCRICIYV